METRLLPLLLAFFVLPPATRGQAGPLQVPAGTATGRQPLEPPGADYVAHEWGTFTSVLDSAGKTLSWNPFRFAAPLPGFVHTSQETKPSYFGSVRMETPVVYFHARQELTLDVTVGFPLGKLTEWYPAAEQPEGALRWRGLRILPEAEPVLPVTLDGEHYFAARGVAAATVRLGGEAEKFLFYRGVGTFEQPLAVRVTGAGEGRRFELENRGADALGAVLVFENRGGEGAWLTLEGLAPGATRRVARELSGFSAGLTLAPLEELLRANGLCADEARAMLATWRRDWFEPGLRAFYVLPRPALERLLPLTLEPAPRALERVLVGRLELFEPELEAEILAAARTVGRGEQAVEQAFAPLGRRLSRFALALLQARAEQEPEAGRAQWPLVQWLEAR